MVSIQENKEELINEVSLHAVTRGNYIPLEDVPDEVFASKMMGDGYAILSEDGVVYAPVSGVITTVFPSNHAVGIRTNNGVEVLVHMGIDTVSLNGKGFTIFVKVGDVVSETTKLAEMDLSYIQSQGKETIISVVITNMDRVISLSSSNNLEGKHQPGTLLEKAVLN